MLFLAKSNVCSRRKRRSKATESHPYSLLVASYVAKQTALNTYNGSECTQSSILATSMALATAVAVEGAADLPGIAHSRCKLSLFAGKSRSLPISQAATAKLRFFFNRTVNRFGLWSSGKKLVFF